MFVEVLVVAVSVHVLKIVALEDGNLIARESFPPSLADSDVTCTSSLKGRNRAVLSQIEQYLPFTRLTSSNHSIDVLRYGLAFQASTGCLIDLEHHRLASIHQTSIHKHTLSNPREDQHMKCTLGFISFQEEVHGLFVSHSN